MTRRQFAFWLGFGLFTLSDTFRIVGLDDLAAATMGSADPKPLPNETSKSAAEPEHWTAAEDEDWSWFERENFIDGQWRQTGTTRPINKATGKRKEAEDVYLDESLMPASMLREQTERPQIAPTKKAAKASAAAATASRSRRLPLAKRRARHGLPPSKWLRSLDAGELAIWLQTIDVPEADVSGMTFWTHLTRDHKFDSARIAGLSIAEQAKLHAAAHFGY